MTMPRMKLCNNSKFMLNQLKFGNFVGQWMEYPLMAQNPSTFYIENTFAMNVVDDNFVCLAQGTIPKTFEQGFAQFI